MVATNDDVTLAEFFARPIHHITYTWTPNSGSVFGQNFNPWTAFFSNPRVSNRISNYHLMQAKLCVKFLVNGNSFYYGKLMADYVILPTYDTVSSFNALEPLNLVQASQRMHLLLDPTTSQGGCMYLPFIWPNNALRVPGAEWNSLGTLYLRELNALKHANASTQPVNISVYIWAEDVKLSVPTAANAGGIVAQANEYTDRPVSNLSSAVSGIARKLVNAPIIGPYARATDMVASGVGAVAKLFGYSRPAQLDLPVHNTPKLISNMVNTDCSDGVTKLTIDSKQELSIDGRIFGAARPDELDIKYLASIPSYLTSFTWTTAAVPQTMLWNTLITPCVNRMSTTGNLYYMPPCAFAAVPFKFWRGTMRYRFQIVASGHHTGRLAFVYDPNSTTNVKETNVAFTKVVDISNEKEFTLDISWANQQTFLDCSNFSSGAYGTTPYGTDNTGLYNGILSVWVINDLATPNSVANNDISINVWVSMCDDAEFAGPTSASLNTMTYAGVVGQANEYTDDTDNSPEIEQSDEKVMDCLPPDDGTYLVYFGERVTSFRQLLKRYNYHSSYYPPSLAAQVWKLTLSDFPFYRGLYASGMHTNGTNTVNYVNMTLLNYLTPAFVGVKGGLRSKYAFVSNTGMYNSTVTVNRNANTTLSNYVSTAIAYVVTTVSAFAKARLTQHPHGLEGMEVVTTTQQPVIEVEFPYYRRYRFDNARNPGMTMMQSAGTSTHTLQCTMTTASTQWIDRYISVGEDFQLFLFQGAPPMNTTALV